MADVLIGLLTNLEEPNLVLTLHCNAVYIDLIVSILAVELSGLKDRR